jgi:hypothetical protein
LFHYSSFQSLGSPSWKDISVFEAKKKKKKAVGQVLSRENYDEQGGLMCCAVYFSQSIRLWNVCSFSSESRLVRGGEV